MVGHRASRTSLRVEVLAEALTILRNPTEPRTRSPADMRNERTTPDRPVMVGSARSVLGRGSQRHLVARPYWKMTSLMA